MKHVRIILNGKGAANPQVRAAIERIREQGQTLEVRATWAGGGAYALMGILTAAKMTPYQGRVKIPGESAEGSFVVMAIGNACQAGGGLRVMPWAQLDDGLLDVLFITDFATPELGLVLEELQDPTNRGNRFVHYRQVPACEVEVPDKVPLNLDGEPHCWDHIRFEVAPRCLPLVLPEDCPLIARGAKAQ